LPLLALAIHRVLHANRTRLLRLLGIEPSPSDATARRLLHLTFPVKGH